MSAFLEKQKLLDWLAERLWNAESTAYNRVIAEIKSGRFDWTSEGD